LYICRRFEKIDEIRYLDIFLTKINLYRMVWRGNYWARKNDYDGRGMLARGWWQLGTAIVEILNL